MGLVDIREKMTSVSQSTAVVARSPSEQVVRKKRTFDIAFLTGQTDIVGEKEKDLDVVSVANKRYSSSGIVIASEDIPFNLTHEGANSDSSSIDVMTNGSLSESESPRPLLCHSPPVYARSKGNKIRNNRSPIKEEIRFESKRTIDINQTSDSLKIKENLQFSTLLPTSAAASPMGASMGGDLNLPHIASTFALLPHMSKFPVHLPGFGGPNNVTTPFSAKMEKCESINISYPMNKIRGGFQDPYAAIATGGYPYPNLMLPQDLNRPPPFTPGQASHQSGPGGMNPSATLLPPSLTALTLPAQNVCAKCNIGFRMTSDLVYHMRSHHKRDCDPLKKKREEKLKCPVCHESFRERHHLTRHMTAHQDRAEEREESYAMALAMQANKPVV